MKTNQTAGGTRVAESDCDPFDAGFIIDPYPHHRALRDAGAVVRLRRYDIWAMARFTDVNDALLDWETYCSSAGVGLADFRKEAPWRPPSPILEADPPLHARTHRVLARVMSPAAIRQLRPAFRIEAERLVERTLARGTIDGVADFARAYPLKVFPDAVGLPPNGREHLLTYGNMAFNAFGPRNDRFVEAMTQAALVTNAIMALCDRESLASDGIGERVYAAADTGEITLDEARMLVRSLLTAGLDTTVNALGNALYCFAKHPGAWAEIVADPTRVRNAFDEVMRYESPVQTFFRTTTRDVVVDGTTLAAGEKVLLFLASANRDPRRWHDPDRFDIERRAGGHVAFGAGIHRCVGEMIGRVEAEIVLTALAERVRKIEFAGATVPRLNNTIRGFEHLPLRFIA